MSLKLFKTALKRLRTICLRLPETNETQSWGHPNFRAGKKTFAVLEEFAGHLCLAIKVDFQRQEHLLKVGRFIETPYIGHQGWISLKIDKNTDWKEAASLVLESYRNVALKRMLKALEDQPPQ
jgi:predicted DNA-binding protein (MmcQ/YjbR family)